MKMFPIQVNVQSKRCVIVGAGAVAERKVTSLRECGAQVRLVAPQATPGLQRLAESGGVGWIQKRYDAAHLDGAFLVIAATDLREVNAAVTRDAQERNVLVCRADMPSDGSFTSPASVTRDDLVLTVSTSGNSPTLAAVLRQRLEDEFGPEWGPLTALLGGLRDHIKAVGDETARRAAVARVLDDSTVWERLRGGNFLEAEARARECLFSSWG